MTTTALSATQRGTLAALANLEKWREAQRTTVQRTGLGEASDCVETQDLEVKLTEMGVFPSFPGGGLDSVNGWYEAITAVHRWALTEQTYTRDDGLGSSTAFVSVDDMDTELRRIATENGLSEWAEAAR